MNILLLLKIVMEEIETAIQAIPDLVDKSDQKITITFGKFKKFGGNVNLETRIFKNLINIISKKVTNNSESLCKKIYFYRNMTLTCSKNKKNIISKRTPIYYSMYNNFCVNIYKEEELTEEQFPIVDKYHNISVQKVINYTYNIKHPIIISFIEESYNNKIINYVKLYFNNIKDFVTLHSSNAEEVKKVIRLILEEIS